MCTGRGEDKGCVGEERDVVVTPRIGYGHTNMQGYRQCAHVHRLEHVLTVHGIL